jgi:ribonuclease BN (tRNA processing enzyme)
MRARLLGSGGWMPTDERETTCLYVRGGDHVLLVDAGSGLRRLLTEPELVHGVRRLSVLLTHFHIDHISGLPFLHDLERIPEREILGPGAAVLQTSTEQLLRRLLEPPFFPSPGLPAAIREVEPPRMRIGDLEVELRIQRRHPHPTLAVRLGRDLALCTDTAYDEENAGFVEGVRVLCHEAFRAGETTDDPGHTSSGEAARLAAAAGVDRLVLVHVNPELRDEEELLRFARPHFPATVVGRDGLELLS